MQIEIINLIVLLGAIQGFTLIFYLFAKQKQRLKSFWYFILFLFSLAFFNAVYALIYMNVHTVAGIPIPVFPFPYKYLIAVSFFFYTRYLFQNKVKSIYFFLFLPAFIYFLLRTYWFSLKLSGIKPYIIKEVYDLGFFAYNEFTYLLFNIVLIVSSLVFFNKKEGKIVQTPRTKKALLWLKQFIIAFLVFTVLHLGIVLFSTVTNDLDSQMDYYVLLIINTLFVYWVGFQGFSQPNSFFPSFQLNNIPSNISPKLAQELELLIQTEKLYRNPQLKVEEVAQALNISSKELSTFIKTNYQKNFSQWINYHRIEEVKQLLTSENLKTYTIVSLAKQAGFNSKSTFNLNFKKYTGLTPKAFLEKQEK